MTERPAKASIVSGYFNPLHQGHLDLFEAAQARSGYLIVIVNNDHQQVLKKGRVIQVEDVRARIVRALRIVDDVYIAVEQGPGINESFDLIRAAYPDTELEFCNGGDRRNVDELPADEVEAGARNNISMIYGIGGTDKADSSTRILSDMEA
ncbi:glycerol-3-phosphate cytidylyltransferase [Amycolatopsis sp. MJM2582]|uniref:RfaE bifunctional protein n=2 Tax=Amycolatopsis keratiniphila TaxID=129921 RepID=R4STV2_9PSEU|nr:MULTISPECIES: HldE family cytidylyltransferase [Amycolatopsis]AGM03591.1 RfaE bifunctional protein [Amycolatopsis keratiniphila]KFZ82531.1 glycerol-3-phosphate cytidylyltransferase [Amycolatopsis sp. MJM2582]OLZ56957.1 glycerol-3-phosphate cytidylyltransferase [Amycolatopsis keratiniphila subsp. nogabecina]ONF65576.1 glycerol-3-phosphate cytidylyltransferase [Amycolatopsis keratiniphila subsp. keratiniphila]RSN28066.1 HldE family cytidylyltransferase [Amycolatopsis sp. WAC 04169]